MASDIALHVQAVVSRITLHHMVNLLGVSLVLHMCQKGSSLPLTAQMVPVEENCSCGAHFGCPYWQSYFTSIGAQDPQKCKELVDQLGCDCSYCSSVTFCDCDMPKIPLGAFCDAKDTPTSNNKMKGGSSCIPRCPSGTVASESLFECRHGRLLVPRNRTSIGFVQEEKAEFECLNDVPNETPHCFNDKCSNTFMDMDPAFRSIAGYVKVKVPSSRNVVGVNLYVGVANGTRLGDVPLASATVAVTEEDEDFLGYRSCPPEKTFLTDVPRHSVQDYMRWVHDTTVNGAGIFPASFFMKYYFGGLFDKNVERPPKEMFDKMSSFLQTHALSLQSGMQVRQKFYIHKNTAQISIEMTMVLKNNDTLQIQTTSIIKCNRVVSHEEAKIITLWIPSSKVMDKAQVFLIFLKNAKGESTRPLQVPFEDISVDPTLPHANTYFKVTVGGMVGSLALALVEGANDNDCRSSTTYLARALEAGHASTFAVFNISRGGIYTLCRCPGVKSCSLITEHTDAIGKVSVTGRFLNVSVLPADSLSRNMLPMNTVQINVQGLGFYGTEKIYAVYPPATCSDTGITDSSIVGISSAGAQNLAAKKNGTFWSWSMVAPQTGNLTICIMANACKNVGVHADSCNALSRSHGVRIAAVHIDSCRAPCATCVHDPDTCTSCIDGWLPDNRGTMRKAGTLIPSSPCQPKRLIVEQIARWKIKHVWAETSPVDILVASSTCNASNCIEPLNTKKRGKSSNFLKNNNAVCAVGSGSCLIMECSATEYESDTCLVPDWASCPVDDPEIMCYIDYNQYGNIRNVSYGSCPAAEDMECNEAHVHSGIRSKCLTQPLREPSGLALLGNRVLLIADESNRLSSFPGGQFIWQEEDQGNLRGGLRKLDLATGDLDFACHDCRPKVTSHLQFKADGKLRVEYDTQNCSVYMHHTGERVKSEHLSRKEIEQLQHLLGPSKVRVSPTGKFWLVVETNNFRVKRIDASTFKISIVAGSGAGLIPSKHDGRSDLYLFLKPTAKRTGSSFGDGGLATRAKLCDPSDVAIHPNEEEFLIAEGSFRKLNRIRLVDTGGIINTIGELSDMECAQPRCDCTRPIETVDWLPLGRGKGSGFVVACGRLWVFNRIHGRRGNLEIDWDKHEIRTPRGFGHVIQARVMPEGRLLLVLETAVSTSHEFVMAAAKLPSSANGRDLKDLQVIVGNGTGMHDVVSWANEMRLPNIRGILPAQDGSVLFTTHDERESKVMRVRPACGAGHGYNDGNACATPNGGDGDACTEKQGCAPCLAGKYNDGTYIYCEKCPEHKTSMPESDTCVCERGYYLASGACQEAEPSYYVANESQLPCGEGHSGWTTFYLPTNVTQMNTTKHGPQWGEPVITDFGTSKAHDKNQCGCCFGWHDLRIPGTCEKCPVGAWCAGELASPKSQLRQRNGYWLTTQSPENSLMPYKCADPLNCWWTPYPLFWFALAKTGCNKSHRDCYPWDCAGVQVGGKPSSCPNGRRGTVCSTCASGSFVFAHGRLCEKCPSGLIMFLTIVVRVLFLGLCFLALRFLKRVLLHIFYMCVAALIAVFAFCEHLRVLHGIVHVTWPLWVHRSMAFNDLLLWHLLPLSSTCLVGNTLVARRLILAIAPPAAIIAPFLIGIIFRNKTAINLSGLVAAVLVVPWLSAEMSYFECYVATRNSGIELSSVSLMLWSPDVVCPSGTGEPLRHKDWLEVLPLAILALLMPLAWMGLQIYLFRALQVDLHWALQSIPARYRSKVAFWDLSAGLRILVLHASIAMEPVLGLSNVLAIISASNMVGLILCAVYKPHKEVCNNVLESLLFLATVFLSLLGMELAGDADYLAIRLRDEAYAPVAPHSHDILMWSLQVSIVSVFISMGYVMFQASRDLMFPKGELKKEAESVRTFALHLSTVSELINKAKVHFITRLVERLDTSSQDDLLFSMHKLEQVLLDKKRLEEKSFKPTRLTPYNTYLTDEVDAVLATRGKLSNLISSVRSSRSFVDNTAIAQVLSTDMSTLIGEEQLVQSRRSKKRSFTGASSSTAISADATANPQVAT